MHWKTAKQITGVFVVVFFTFSLLFQPLLQAATGTKCNEGGYTACPYFRVNGGDIATGGWFKNGVACIASNYQAPTYSPLSNQYQGAIMSFAEGGPPRTGASSDLGAMSLGFIESDAPSYYGFYTGPAGTNSDSFANTGSNIGSNWGGIFEGADTYRNCIPDYYGDRQPIATAIPTPASLNLGAANGTYSVAGSTTVSGTIAAGSNLAYFVQGDVIINGNITYASHTASTSPKFALVVNGNIYITPGVTRIDGWYIAQPPTGGSVPSNNGQVWTCSNGAVLTDQEIRSQCKNPLTINGALTAKQINLGRITESAAGGIPGTPAETINFIPEMTIGGAFFNDQSRRTSTIQSLISLPPLF